MLIHQNFTGGNIRIVEKDGCVIQLDNELRDTTQDWFYWAFCIEGAAAQTLTFCFPKTRIGYYGPAVSHDLKSWRWLGKGEDPNAFTYTFGADENKVYFAHNMLYHPDRFAAFANRNGLQTEEFCLSRKGRSVPCLRFGEGSHIILLTARHHACESTGNYVLEGVLETMIRNPIPDTRVICVPFVDYDGVVDGDQGKARAPHDQNRDYDYGIPAIYPEVAELRKIADTGILYGFDFHSPYHTGGNNDNVFVVRKDIEKTVRYDRFGTLLEDALTENALKYYCKNDMQPNVSWNKPDTPTFACYMDKYGGAELSFTLETTYFGKEDNIFNQEKAVELGRCFAEALRSYENTRI